MSRSSLALRATFFGDSICVGQGVSIYSGWVTRIAGEIERIAESSGREIVVTNASVNGNTTRQALERMPYDVQSQGVDIMIVQFGMNDCNYWRSDNGVPRVSPEAFAANLKEIITRGQIFGAKKIFLHCNHPTTRDQTCMEPSSVTYDQSNRLYNGIVRRVAGEVSGPVEFTDIEAAFDEHTGGNRKILASLLLADGLHLSKQGHELYFNVAAKKIVQTVSAAVAGKWL